MPGRRSCTSPSRALTGWPKEIAMLDHLDEFVEHERQRKRSLGAFAVAVVLAIALWLMFVHYL
jgi:hypothetical protein